MLSKIELNKIIESIRSAENKTSAEIRVCVVKRCKIDPLEAAYGKFVKLEMEKTALRNSVLIFVAPNDKKVAIVGDEAINRVCEDGFWNSTLEGMIELFKQDTSICEGIIYGVDRVGELMKKYFPLEDNDINELNDEVIIDEE